MNASSEMGEAPVGKLLLKFSLRSSLIMFLTGLRPQNLLRNSMAPATYSRQWRSA